MSADKKKSEQSVSGKPTPKVLSINICDCIIRDEETKKISLIGSFNTIKANSFPCTHPRMHILVALTDGHGKYKTEVRFVSLDEVKAVAGMIGDLEFHTPLQVIELNICWQQLIFNKPGKYAVEVLCDDSLIQSRIFYVIGPEQKMLPSSGTEVR